MKPKKSPTQPTITKTVRYSLEDYNEFIALFGGDEFSDHAVAAMQDYLKSARRRAGKQQPRKSVQHPDQAHGSMADQPAKASG